VKDVPEWKGKEQILPWLRGFRDFCNGYTVRSGDVQSAIFRCKARITADPSGSWFQETDASTFVRNDVHGNPEWGPSWLALAQHLEEMLVPQDWYERAAENWIKLRQTQHLGKAEDFTDFKTRFLDGLNKYNVARRAKNFGTLPQHEATLKFVDCLPPGIYEEVNLIRSDVLSQPWDHYDRDFTVAWNKVKGHKALTLAARAEEAAAMQASARQAARDYLEEVEVDFVTRRKTPQNRGICTESWDQAPAEFRGPLTVWKDMKREDYNRVSKLHHALVRDKRCAMCRRKKMEHQPVTLFTELKPLDKVTVRIGSAREENTEAETKKENPSEENS
jgi:hypothetical protein